MAATTVHDQRWPGPGRKLTRDVVARAALVYIDRFGSPRLTMRGLGQALGVEAMSLYRYVRGREDLLEAVTSVYLNELRAGTAASAAATWQDYLQTLAAGARRIALEHPHAWTLLVTQQCAPVWLPPPLRSVELVEDLLATLSVYGFSDLQVVTTYRGLSSLLLGQLLAAPAADAPDARTRTDPGYLRGGPLSDDIHVSDDIHLSDDIDRSAVERCAVLLRHERVAVEFDRALQMFLDQVEFGLHSGSRDWPRAEGLAADHCDSSSSNRSRSVSSPASNSSRL